MSVVAAQLIAKVGAEGVDKTKADLQSVGGTVTSVSGIFRSGFAGIAVDVGRKLFELGGAAVKMAGDFQSSMTSLVTGAGESKANIKMVGDGILAMAPQVGTATKELSAGMYMIESSGQHGSQALTTLRDAAMGAKVGSASLADVANGVTTAMTDYAKTHLTAAQATNTLIATVASGKTHMGDLASAMSSILPTSASVGVSFTDVSAAMATMTGEGTPAADSATYLRQLLMALESPAKKGATALREIGLSATQVADDMKKSLPATLQEITDHLKKKFPEGSAAYVSALKDIAGGSKQMQGILELTGSHLDVLKSNFKSIADAVRQGGASITGWSDVQKDFNFKLDQAKAIVETLGIKLGAFLLPILGKVLDAFSTVAPKIMDSLGRVGTYIGQVLKTVNLSDFQQAWKAVSTEVEHVGYAFGKLASTLAPVKGDFDPIAEVIQKLAKGALGTVTSLLWDISGAFIAVDRSLQTGKGPLIEIGNIFNSFAPELKTLASLIGGEVMREFRDFGALAQELGRWFMASVVPALQQALPGFLNLAHTILGTVIPAFFQIRGIVMDVIEHAFKTFGPIIERIVPPLIRFAGLLANDVANGLKFIMPYVLQAAKAIGQFADEIMTRVAPIIMHWLDQTQSGVQAFSRFWAIIWPSISGVLKGAWDLIVGVVKTAWSLVSGIIKIGLDLMSGNWKQAWNDLKDMLGGVWDGIKQVISGGLQIINNLFGGLPGQALQWGENLIGSFIQGIRNMIGGVGQAAQDVMNAVHNFIGVHSPTKMGPGRTLDQWGINLVRQFTNDIRSKTPEARLAAENMMLQIQQAISGETTQLNMAKLSGNVAAQLAAKNTLFDLNAQFSQYKNVINAAGYSYNAKDRTSPIGFGGQTVDQMVALAGVNRFTKDLAHQNASSQKDAQNLFASLLKSLDGFAQKIAMAQLEGNTALVTQLQNQQTTQQTELSLFQILATQHKLNVDTNNLGHPITSFGSSNAHTAVAPSSVQYQFLGSRNQQTAPMVIQVQPNHIYIDGRQMATALLPHTVDAIRYNTGGHI